MAIGMVVEHGLLTMLGNGLPFLGMTQIVVDQLSAFLRIAKTNIIPARCEERRQVLFFIAQHESTRRKNFKDPCIGHGAVLPLYHPKPVMKIQRDRRGAIQRPPRLRAQRLP